MLDRGETVYMMVAKGDANMKEVSQQWTLLRTFLEEYEDVFPADLSPGLPPVHGIQNQIDLTLGSPLTNKAAYHFNTEEMKELQRKIEELMEMGYFCESLSQCVAPVLLVLKKDGGWRMCICSSAVNNIIIKYRFLIPRLDDILNELHEAVIFSKIDLRSGYHQVR